MTVKMQILNSLYYLKKIKVVQRQSAVTTIFVQCSS